MNNIYICIIIRKLLFINVCLINKLIKKIFPIRKKITKIKLKGNFS